MREVPVTRWELAREEGRSSYGEHFAQLVAEGADVEGEARLADALVGRGARILDVGSGMGRVAAALTARGHEVVAVEPDAELRAQSRETYPDLAVLPLDALQVTPGELGRFDLVVAVGNVLVFLAEGTERRVLAGLRDVLSPGGRVLVGFHLTVARPGARLYPPAEFVEDVESVGLRVQHRFGGYDLRPADDEYAVWVLERPSRRPDELERPGG